MDKLAVIFDMDGVLVDSYQAQSDATAAVVSGKDDAMLADSPVGAYAVKQTNGQLALVGSELVAQVDGLVLATCTSRPAIRWDRPTIVVEMGRPSTLTCRVTVEGGAAVRTTVSGSAVPVAKGEIRVP